jgi:hypothetical protein
VPLDEDIEGGHGEGEARLKICPASINTFAKMAMRQGG